MKKVLIIISISLAVLFVLGMLFVTKTQNDYKDPEYQAYKDKYFQCVDTGSTLTPDAQIYKAWKNNEPINCQ